MSNNDNQAQVVYDPTVSEVVVRRKKHKTLKTPFAAIGPLTNIRFKRNAMKEDVFDKLTQVSKGALEVFNDLKYNRSVENNLTVCTKRGTVTRTQKETISRKIRELREVDLVRAVKSPLQDTDNIRSFNVPKGTYIINPDLIRCLNQDEAEHYWEQCAEGEEVG